MESVLFLTENGTEVIGLYYRSGFWVQCRFLGIHRKMIPLRCVTFIGVERIHIPTNINPGTIIYLYTPFGSILCFTKKLIENPLVRRYWNLYRTATSGGVVWRSFTVGGFNRLRLCKWRPFGQSDNKKIQIRFLYSKRTLFLPWILVHHKQDRKSNHCFMQCDL